MIQGKPAPLDYDVEIPRFIPLNMSDDSPKYLGRFDHVPVFGEYPPNRNKQRGVIEAEYGDYLKDSYTLRELILYFEKFVALIIKTADSLQKPDLRDWERTALLDNFYGNVWVDWDGMISAWDNFYYAQSIPELRAIEVALYFLSSPNYKWQMDVAEARQRADVLKLQLWQTLPRFFQAHRYARRQPMSYRQDEPYPLFHTADDFISGLRPVVPQWIHWRYEDAQEYLPHKSKTPQINKLSFELDEGKISTDIYVKDEMGKTFWIDNRTYMADYMGLIEFTEDVLMCKDPARYGYDSEGPISEFATATSNWLDLVKFALYLNWNEHENFINGFFDRQQLVTDLVTLCDLIIEHSFELRHEPYLREPLVRRLNKLKSIM